MKNMRGIYMRLLISKLQGQKLQVNLCRYMSENTHVPHVAVVGSGPAGFYTAQQLLKLTERKDGHPSLKVDIYEKLPVPFGLVRFGVAPDHPEVKNCINAFTQTAHNERCNFIGNVEVGKDVTIPELQESYTAVVLCYGASNDRRLDIPGEDLQNVISARSFVGWYNGLPEDKELKVDLDCDTAVVVGHGNVALDVARVLLSPVDILANTDISENALEALTKSRVRRIMLIGRRGPLQVSFTIKELREMITLPGCRTVISPEDVSGISDVIEALPRPRRRLTELLHKTGVDPTENQLKAWAAACREWHLKFLRSPIEILSNQTGQRPEAVHFVINKLQGNVLDQQVAVPSTETEGIPCGLVLRSIGYSGIKIDSSLPFDPKRGIIPNKNNRVNNYKGLYCSGWIAQGPVFVILGTMNDGFATGKAVLEDIASDQLSSKGKSGKEAIISLLHKKGVKTVNFEAWEKIDKMEIQMGEKKGKPREKITSVDKMLQIALS